MNIEGLLYYRLCYVTTKSFASFYENEIHIHQKFNSYEPSQMKTTQACLGTTKLKSTSSTNCSLSCNIIHCPDGRWCWICNESDDLVDGLLHLVAPVIHHKIPTWLLYNIHKLRLVQAYTEFHKTSQILILSDTFATGGYVEAARVWRNFIWGKHSSLA